MPPASAAYPPALDDDTPHIPRLQPLRPINVARRVRQHPLVGYEVQHLNLGRHTLRLKPLRNLPSRVLVEQLRDVTMNVVLRCKYRYMSEYTGSSEWRIRGMNISPMLS